MMTPNIVTVDFHKINVFWNQGYDIIISVHGVTNKVLPRELNYVLDVLMWPKFDNSSISMTEVIIALIL